MKKILIVDDSLFMRKVLSGILSDKYKVSEAVNGHGIVDKFQKEKPDLVLLDVVMPEVDGVKTLKLLMEADSNVKVLMVTAVGQDSIIEECKKIGAKDYVIKPFDANVINSKIKEYLQ